MDASENDRLKLRLPTFFHIFLRSFFIQGSFSFTYRQNTGFAFCLEPAGNVLWETPDERRAFLLRHMEYYNGNPFMVTLVLGAVARLEEMLKRGEIGESTIVGFKKAVGAATGSIGDRFFWATLRPLSIIVGLFSIYYFGIQGIAVTLALFNVPTILLRWHWLRRGYTLGTAVVGEIQNRHVHSSIDRMEIGVAALLAFMTVFLLGNRWGFVSIETMIAGIALFFTSTFLFKHNKGVISALSVSMAAVIIYSIVRATVFY